MLISACLSIVFAVAEPVEIRYKMDLDEPLRYIYEDVTENRTSAMDQTTTVVTETRVTTRTERIEARDDGSLILRSTTERVASKIEGPGVSLEFDSDDEDFEQRRKDPTVASIAGTLDISVKLHMTPDGEILGVPNMNEINKMLDSVPDPAVKQGLMLMLNEQSLIAMNEANYAMLPEEPVEIGDSWNREIDIPMGGGPVITIDARGSLEDIERLGERRVAVISLDGALRTETLQGGVRIKITASDLSGTMRFDIGGGFLRSLEMESESTLEGTSTMDGSVVVTQNLTQTISMSLIEP